MKAIFLSVLALVISTNLSAQHTTKRDTVTHDHRQNRNGIHGVDYISLGRGIYSSSSTPRLAGNFALMAEYRYNHFYANAGIGCYLLTADVMEGNLGIYVRHSKSLIALPTGIGFISTSKSQATIQFGIDVPYLAEINLKASEMGFALSPRFCITWDVPKKKRAIGIMAHGLFNLRMQHTDVYNPTYFGLALFSRYY